MKLWAHCCASETDLFGNRPRKLGCLVHIWSLINSRPRSRISLLGSNWQFCLNQSQMSLGGHMRWHWTRKEICPKLRIFSFLERFVKILAKMATWHFLSGREGHEARFNGRWKFIYVLCWADLYRTFISTGGMMWPVPVSATSQPPLSHPVLPHLSFIESLSLCYFSHNIISNLSVTLQIIYRPSCPVYLTATKLTGFMTMRVAIMFSLKLEKLMEPKYTAFYPVW